MSFEGCHTAVDCSLALMQEDSGAAHKHGDGSYSEWWAFECEIPEMTFEDRMHTNATAAAKAAEGRTNGMTVFIRNDSSCSRSRSS